MPLRHSKVSSKSDGPDSTLIRPSDWNDDHVIPGQTAGDLIVRGSSEWDRLAIGSSGQLLQVVSGAPQWANVPAPPDNSVSTVKIQNDAVTFAKMQNVNAARVVGRRSGSSGDPEELSATSPLEITTGSALRISPASTNGFQLQTISGAVAWAADPFALLMEALFLPSPTTNWRSLWPFTGAAGTQALTAGRCYFIPFVVYQPRAITHLGIEVSTASAGTAEVAIYDSDGTNGRPGTRLAYVSGLSTGATGIVSGTVSVTLEPGLYWAALRGSAAATLRAAAGAFGFAVNGTSRFNHLFNSDAALNDPVTTDPTSLGTGNVPHVYARWS